MPRGVGACVGGSTNQNIVATFIADEEKGLGGFPIAARQSLTLMGAEEQMAVIEQTLQRFGMNNKYAPAFLKHFVGKKIVLAVDDSGSMGTACKNDKALSRWDIAKATVTKIVDFVKALDATQHCDLHFLNADGKMDISLNDVEGCFGKLDNYKTPLIRKLRELERKYFGEETITIVITDGEPTDGKISDYLKDRSIRPLAFVMVTKDEDTLAYYKGSVDENNAKVDVVADFETEKAAKAKLGIKINEAWYLAKVLVGSSDPTVDEDEGVKHRDTDECKAGGRTGFSSMGRRDSHMGDPQPPAFPAPTGPFQPAFNMMRYSQPIGLAVMTQPYMPQARYNVVPASLNMTVHQPQAKSQVVHQAQTKSNGCCPPFC